MSKYESLNHMPLTLFFFFAQEEIPAGLTLERIEDGAAEMRNGDDFAIKLILVPAPPPDAFTETGKISGSIDQSASEAKNQEILDLAEQTGPKVQEEPVASEIQVCTL